VPRVALFANIL